MCADFGHEEDFVSVAARQGLPHPLLRAVVVVFPGVVQKLIPIGLQLVVALPGMLERPQ